MYEAASADRGHLAASVHKEHSGQNEEGTSDLHRITNAILVVDGVVRTSTAIFLDEVIPYRPHALLRVAAGSWRGPARSQARP